jgi:hypothetical protein
VVGGLEAEVQLHIINGETKLWMYVQTAATRGDGVHTLYLRRSLSFSSDTIDNSVLVSSCT